MIIIILLLTLAHKLMLVVFNRVAEWQQVSSKCYEYSEYSIRFLTVILAVLIYPLISLVFFLSKSLRTVPKSANWYQVTFIFHKFSPLWQDLGIWLIVWLGIWSLMNPCMFLAPAFADVLSVESEWLQGIFSVTRTSFAKLKFGWSRSVLQFPNIPAHFSSLSEVFPSR